MRTKLKIITDRFKSGGVGRHISWTMLQSLFEAGVMTVATLLAADLFGPVSWGQLGVVLTGVQLIAMIADGFYASVMKFVADATARSDPGAAALGWHFGWLSVTVLFVLAALLALVAASGLAMEMSIEWILLAIVLATARGWRAVLDGGFRAQKNFRSPAIAGVACSALMAGGIIASALAGSRVTGYLMIMAAGTVLNCTWLAIVYRRQQFGVAANPVSYLEFLRYSFPLAMRGAAAFLFIKVNVWILGHLSTPYDTGQFRLADQFITIPALVLSAVLAALTPRIAEAQMHSPKHLALLLSKIYGFMLLLTLPLALFFWLNEPVITALFPDYKPASHMLRYFAPAMAVQGLGYAASILLVQGGQPGAAFLLTLLPGLANVIVAYVGFRAGGVNGLVAGTATVHVLTYVATVVVAHRILKLPFRVRFH